VNWTALLVVLVLAAAAATIWISLAAKLVADEEKTKELAEAESRRLERLREAANEERHMAAVIKAQLDAPAEPGEGEEGADGEGGK
jgi:uncharacterized membrane protein (DUF106 family)